MKSNVSRCKSCGAGVEWVATENGKKIIIDSIPDKKGNIIFVTKNGRSYARFVKPEECRSSIRYSSHFVTCPDAEYWKGRSKRKENDMENQRQEAIYRRRRKPTRDMVEITLDELRNLYRGSRVRPSPEVTRVMKWLKGEFLEIGF